MTDARFTSHSTRGSDDFDPRPRGLHFHRRWADCHATTGATTAASASTPASPTSGTQAFLWQPDSDGFFFVSDKGVLFTVTEPGGTPIRVDAGSRIVSVPSELDPAQMDIGWVWSR